MMEANNSHKLVARNTEVDYSFLWHKQPDLIRHFIEQRPEYEQLCIEIAYILKKRFMEYGIETSTITWRAKTLNSFIEKIQRKNYQNPLEGVTDFAGVRIVYLYKKDFSQIENTINNEFEVLDKIDKLEEKGTDQFGYLASHFIAKLGRKSIGARYEDLRNLTFEIQVRTVLQDAWAIIDHHLAYKHESDVPKHLLRKLTRIAAMFEMIDDDFDEIRQSIKIYIADLNESSESDTTDFLNHSLDLDSFLTYLKWKFKNLPLEQFAGQAELIFGGIDKKKFRTLLELEEVVQSTELERAAIDSIFNKMYGDSIKYAATQIAIALGIIDANYRNRANFGHRWREAIDVFLRENTSGKKSFRQKNSS